MALAGMKSMIADDSHAGLHGEAVRTQLAKNLLLARSAAGFTQDVLAEHSGVSRATIAQLESATTDCRLTTLTDIALAFEVSPIVLLLQEVEIASLATWVSRTALSRLLEQIPESEIRTMNTLRRSGLQKNLTRVAQLAVQAVRRGGYTSRAAAVGAAIGAGILPGMGMAVGTLVGVLLEKHHQPHDGSVTDGSGI